MNEIHRKNGKLTKAVFRQLTDNPDEKELLLSLFPAMKKYKEEDVKFIQINCKFVMQSLK